jgi:putative spermidine/putrescine transport system substrate-binding protein
MKIAAGAAGAAAIAPMIAGTRPAFAQDDVWAGEPDMAKAAEQAQALVTYGMPADWANYGAVYEAFWTSLGIEGATLEANHTDTDMSSLEEITKFDAEKANPVAMFADIGMTFGPLATEKEVVPSYLPPLAADLPDGYKGATGGWVATFTGVPSFVINKKAIAEQGLPTPASWQDLLDPAFKGKIGSPGDPTGSGTAQTTFIAWSYANGGDAQNMEPGVEFAKQIIQQYNTAGGSNDLLEKGEIVAWIRYDFNCQGSVKALTEKGIDAETIIPSVSIYAPSALMANKYNEANADCIKAFMNFVLSDEAAAKFAEFGARPIRYVLGKQELAEEAKANLLPDEKYAGVVVVENFTGVSASEIADLWTEEVLGG